MRRIDQGGNVRGVSLKLQEEERERRMDFVPSVSAIDISSIKVDADTKEMLEKLQISFPYTVDTGRRENRRHNKKD